MYPPRTDDRTGRTLVQCLLPDSASIVSWRAPLAARFVRAVGHDVKPRRSADRDHRRIAALEVGYVASSATSSSIDADGGEVEVYLNMRYVAGQRRRVGAYLRSALGGGGLETGCKEGHVV